MRKLALAVLVSVPLAGAAPLQRANRVPAATPSGKPVSCLRLTDIRDSRVRSDQVIDFTTRGGKVYRNTLRNACPGLGFEQRFAYQTSIGQLCSVDIIRVLQSPNITPGAACGLGEFQPATLSARTKR